MSENKNEKQQEIDTQKEQDEQIRETGQLTLDQNKRKHRIELLTIIGLPPAEAGYATAGLAVRYFLCGLVVILIRGILCEKLYASMAKKSA